MYKIAIAITVACMSIASVQANPMRPDNIAAPKNMANITVKPISVSFNLTDISIIGELRYANINNKQVMLNDLINGYQVTKIDPDYVLLVKGNTHKTLYLTTPGSFKIVPSTEDFPSE